ncbi:MAG: hypothetical protein R2681_11530 [Pyrinomonadaceae bacterium]
MKKRIFSALLTSFISEAILHFVLPGILVAAFGLAVSVGTVLDPLHAGDHLEDIWISVSAVIVSLAAFSFAAFILTGLSIAFLEHKLNSPWNYLLSALVSVVVHYFLLITAVLVLSYAADENTAAFLGVYAFAGMAFTSPLIGLLCCFFIRRNRSHIPESDTQKSQ